MALIGGSSYSKRRTRLERAPQGRCLVALPVTSDSRVASRAMMEHAVSSPKIAGAGLAGNARPSAKNQLGDTAESAARHRAACSATSKATRASRRASAATRRTAGGNKASAEALSSRAEPRQRGDVRGLSCLPTLKNGLRTRRASAVGTPFGEPRVVRLMAKLTDFAGVAYQTFLSLTQGS